MKQPTYKRGIVTLELLIALAVGVLMLSGAAMISFGGQTAGLDTELSEHGLYKASSHMENVVAGITNNWNAVVDVDNSDFYKKGGYTFNISPCIKGVSATTTWTSEKSRGLGLGLETLLGSIDIAKAMGGGCDPFPPVDPWDTPTSFGTISSSVVDGSATDIAFATIGGSNYAFLTTTNSAASTKKDFWPFDVSNPKVPKLIPAGTLDLGDGLNSIAVAKDTNSGRWFAYVATDVKDTSLTCPGPGNKKPFTKQLQVIEITSPAVSSVVASRTLSGIDACGSEPAGFSIYYYDKKVYVGTKETAGSEFTIFDVSDPENPLEIGNIAPNRNVNDIVVSDGLAYLATGPGASGVNNPFRIYDVDPSSGTFKQLKGSFVATETNKQEGRKLYILGYTVYLGLERATGSNKDFYVLDVSNPASLKKLTSNSAINLNLQGNGSGVRALVVQGPYAFIGVSDTNPQGSGIQILNISNPNNLWRVNFCTKGDPVTKDPSGLIFKNDLLFGSFSKNESLRVLYDDPNLSC